MRRPGKAGLHLFLPGFTLGPSQLEGWGCLGREAAGAALVATVTRTLVAPRCHMAHVPRTPGLCLCRAAELLCHPWAWVTVGSRGLCRAARVRQSRNDAVTQLGLPLG